MPEMARMSPLGGLTLSAGLSATITEVARGMITVRADFADPAMAAVVADVAGTEFPAPLRASLADGRRLVRFAPDEALLCLPLAAVDAALARLGEGLSAAHHLVVDVSDARATFLLEGAGARETLAKGAPVDLSPRAFGVGCARRTHLGQVAAAFWMTGPDAFELVCPRSAAEHVAEWLRVAASADARVGHH